MNIFVRLVTAAVVLTAFPAAVFSQGVTVFEENSEGYTGFRIPAIVKASDGSLLAFAEGRKNGKGDAGDIDLVMKRSSDGGKTWGKLHIVWDDGANTCGNPAPVVIGTDGTVVMLLTWNLGTDIEKDIENGRSEDSRRVFVTRSSDNGHTWSTPEEITRSVKLDGWHWYATGPCHAIVKTRKPFRGRIIVPANHSEIGADGKPQSRSQLLYSDDKGRSWHLGAVTDIHGNENTVAELKDGSLLLNMRRTSKTDSVRLYAISRDGGATFSEQGRIGDLLEPRCQGSIINVTTRRGKASETLLFSNPRSRKRLNMTISKSKDNGRHWSPYIQIYGNNSAYSDMVLLSKDSVGILYENGEEGNTYKRISFKTVEIR